MSAAAWIFAAAWVVTSVCFVAVNYDRQMWQERALRRWQENWDLMARAAQLTLALQMRGIPVPPAPADVTDLHDAKTPADVLRIPEQRRGQ